MQRADVTAGTAFRTTLWLFWAPDQQNTQKLRPPLSLQVLLKVNPLVTQVLARSDKCSPCVSRKGVSTLLISRTRFNRLFVYLISLTVDVFGQIGKTKVMDRTTALACCRRVNYSRERDEQDSA